MIRLFFASALLCLGAADLANAQSADSLRHSILRILNLHEATVGVAIMAHDGEDTLSIDGDGHFPLQSVFKFHIAIVVLSEVDKGKLALNQKIKIEKKELLPDLHSPIRDKYPNGATLKLSTILEYTVSQSDNVGCDVLLRLIGGPKVVEDYFVNHGFTDVSIRINEEVQQSAWDLQFQNWTTPREANEVLKTFYDNQNGLLSPESHAFLWKTMKRTTTGAQRLKGQLPKGTRVAHKTGTSGTNDQAITAAVNDIGIVFLPGGRYYYISVFVTGSKEDAATNEKIIAEVSKAAWDYFSSKMK